MQNLIIRNDDVSADIDLSCFREFCRICDEANYRILQAITPCGRTRPIEASMINEEIRALGSTFLLPDNTELLSLLKSRNDLIGLHGLWHTHRPYLSELKVGIQLLKNWGLEPSFFIPPFNEGDYGDQILGLKVSAVTERLEDFLKSGKPSSEIVYLHSWRFDGSHYKMEDLEKCLRRIRI